MSDKTTIKKNVTTKEENKPVPKGAIIMNTTTTTDVEEIENGYLITKTTETKWKADPKAYSDYTYETKKWYSKEDPLTITSSDKGLAEAFAD